MRRAWRARPTDGEGAVATHQANDGEGAVATQTDGGAMAQLSNGGGDGATSNRRPEHQRGAGGEIDLYKADAFVA